MFALLPPRWLDAYLRGAEPMFWMLGPGDCGARPTLLPPAGVLGGPPVDHGAGRGGRQREHGGGGVGPRRAAPASGRSRQGGLTEVGDAPGGARAGVADRDRAGITTVCVFTSGLIGSAIGPALLSRVGVRSPVSRGLAFGTLSHAIGTARALEEDPLSGAAGVVALTLSALLISAGAIALSLLGR